MKRRDFLKLSAGSALAVAAQTQAASAQNALSKIKHIVVLMLENRSFDNLLGKLYPKSDRFDGLSGNEFNLDLTGQRILVNNLPGASANVLTTPDPNPGEHWVDINEQLFETVSPAAGAMPTMGGFVRNYLNQGQSGRYDPSRIMHYFTPEQVPVISQLARQFAVSDRWFASSPTQTWPNRFFLHTGTANGYENNAPLHFPYLMPTIFDRLQAMDPANGCRIYFHDVPQSAALAKLWQIRHRFSRYSTFRDHAAQGALPSYAFIEPDYLPYLGNQNDLHPPTSVAAGERLLADVYNCLRQGPAWTSTLLVVIFDEHGGCYDHVPPPPAVPPSKSPTAPFNFDRYGVRVPALLISPYIPAGSVLRPAGERPFDHTSVIATLRKRFELGAPLTERDAVAPAFDTALSLPEPANMGPDRIEAPTAAEPRMAQRGAQPDEPLSDLQASLVELSRTLPDPGQDVDQNRRLEIAPRSGLAVRSLSPVEAGAIADTHVKRFLGEM